MGAFRRRNVMQIRPNCLSLSKDPSAHEPPAAPEPTRPHADAQGTRSLRSGDRALGIRLPAPVVSHGGFSAVRSDGTAHAFVGGNARDAADGGIRRRAAPHVGTRHTGRRPHFVRTAHRGDARRPGPLRNRDGPGRGVARPGPRNMAPRLVAHPPLHRLAHPHRRRRADPLPRHGAPLPSGERELPETDAPARCCRHAVAGSRQPARAPFRRGADAPFAGLGAACAPAPHGRCRRRGAGHDGGRPQRPDPGAAHSLLAQRAVAPAGRIGTPHGDRLRAHQPAAVVAAAAAPRTPAAQPAGRSGRLVFRRRCRIPAQRRPGRRDVHAAAGGIGLRLGICRAERPGRGSLRHAALESRLDRRRQFPALVRRRRCHPRMGCPALPTLPHPMARGEPAGGRLPDRSGRHARHGTARLAPVRHRPAGRATHQSGGHRPGDRRRLRRSVVAAAAPRTPRCAPRMAVGTAAEGINTLARLVAALPGGAAEYTLGSLPTAGIYLLLAAGTLAAWCREPKKNVLLPS